VVALVRAIDWLLGERRDTEALERDLVRETTIAIGDYYKPAGQCEVPP